MSHPSRSVETVAANAAPLDGVGQEAVLSQAPLHTRIEPN